MAKKPQILFVCENGPSRCQMAEGFARMYAGASVQVKCAAPNGDSINEYCKWAMNETGVDVGQISASPLDSIELGQFTHIITLGPEAKESCERVPAGIRVENWEIPDPAAIRGRPSDMISAFRAVRNEIEKRVKNLLSVTLTS